MATSNSYALIIGIGQYQDKRIRTLDYTHSDAEAFHHFLLDKDYCGIPAENVKLLLDEQATLQNIKHSFSGWLKQRSTDKSAVYVFYAGHGGVESSHTGFEKDGMAKYFLPWDTNRDNLYASALSNNDFYGLLNTVSYQKMVIFMDACYSGGVSQTGSRDLGIVENPYERLAEGDGRLVISAAKPNQLSWEDESIGHGIFTHHLLEALSGKADADNDGYVSAMEVYKYLEKNVPESARRLAKGDQHPLLSGDLGKDIILAVNSKLIEENKRITEEKIRHKRRKLFELYDEGHLPQKAYRQAIRLIEKSEDELAAKEHFSKRMAEKVIDGKIEVELFIESLKRIDPEPLPDPPPPGPVKPGPRDPGKEIPKEMKLKFCIYCGTQISKNTKFCIGCGKPYSNVQ